MNSVVLKAALVSVVRRSDVRRLAVWETAAPRAARPPISGDVEVLIKVLLDVLFEPASLRSLCDSRDRRPSGGNCTGESTRTKGTSVPCPWVYPPPFTANTRSS